MKATKAARINSLKTHLTSSHQNEQGKMIKRTSSWAFWSCLRQNGHVSAVMVETVYCQ
jgi:hypothetical protein